MLRARMGDRLFVRGGLPRVGGLQHRYSRAA